MLYPPMDSNAGHRQLTCYFHMFHGEKPIVVLVRATCSPDATNSCDVVIIDFIQFLVLVLEANELKQPSLSVSGSLVG